MFDHLPNLFSEEELSRMDFRQLATDYRRAEVANAMLLMVHDYLESGIKTHDFDVVVNAMTARSPSDHQIVTVKIVLDDNFS